MSIPAVGWVTKQVRGISTTERAVLYVLADMASLHHGKQQAWPSAGTIAEIIGVAPRTVNRALHSLEERGLISRGSASLVASIRGDKRPTVWALETG